LVDPGCLDPAIPVVRVASVPAALTVGFDLDLTLVDSQDRILGAFIRALRDLGVEVSAEDLVPHLGTPLAHTAAMVAPGVDADTLVLRYRHYYDEVAAPRTLPMPGAAESLRCVRAAGGRTVVVSAKFTPAVHRALDEAGLTTLVDVVYGELFAEDKATALIAEGASIYVGDHPGDMAAARAANAYAVGVTTGANDSLDLRAAGADLALPSLDVFVTWLPRHLLELSTARL
jgi:phosphoglycolate phosphatase